MGGHGGLNILPQKRWNVYRNDNRQKVEEDERLLNQAQQEQSRTDSIQNLNQSISQIRSQNPNTNQERLAPVSIQNRNGYQVYQSRQIQSGEQEEEKQGAGKEFSQENSIFQKAKREIKKRERDDRKFIKQELIASKVNDQQHVNLFKQEQIDEMIKQKRLEASNIGTEGIQQQVQGKEDYSKRSGNLGELFKDRHRPWEKAPEEVQEQLNELKGHSKVSLDKSNRIEQKYESQIEQYLVKQQIDQFRNGKTLHSQAENNEEGFCKVIELNTVGKLVSKGSKSDNNAGSSEDEDSIRSKSDRNKKKDKHKKEKKDKKSKKEKKDKKEKKREKKERKRREKEELEQLRKERLKREEIERQKIEQLLASKSLQNQSSQI